MELLTETAKVLRKITIEIYTEAKEKNMVEKRELDKTQNLYYTINSKKSQYENQVQGGSEYGSDKNRNEPRSQEVYTREQIRGDRETSQRTGEDVRADEIGDMENGRQGRDNEQPIDLHNTGEQLSQIDNGIHTTSSMDGRDNNRTMAIRNRRYDKDRFMGSTNEREQEDGLIDRRNQPRYDESILHNNATEQAKHKEDNGREERRTGQNIGKPGTNTEQVENTAGISNELQEEHQSRISGQSERENRDSGREISEQISGQNSEQLLSSKTINGTGNSAGSKERNVGRDSEQESSINNNINVGVDDKSTPIFVLPQDLYEDWQPLEKSMDDNYNLGLMYADAGRYFKDQHYKMTNKILDELYKLADKRTDYIEFNKEIERMVNSNEFNDKQKSHILEYISKSIEKGFKTEEKYKTKEINNEEINVFNYLNTDNINNTIKGNDINDNINQYKKDTKIDNTSERTEEINNEEVKTNINQNKEELLKLDYINENNQNSNKFSLKEKFEDNVNAIKTLKRIENEKRNATKEEQAILAKYVGWGGLANYCLDEVRASKENLQIVKELLTEEELRDAKSSVNSAYYTPDYIVKEIYEKILDFGFKGGKILEPSCGTGKFFMNMPKEMRENSNIVGIEKDNISARISKLLYPSIDIKNKGFEEEKIENNTYNLIIGNIPFGSMKLYDKEYEKDNLLIHDYFINKSLDKLADGGIAAIVSTTGTMDKINNKARTLFAEKANFLGAVRLPVGAFGDTKNSTDILFFQKNNQNKLGINQSFVKAEPIFNEGKDRFSETQEYVNTITNETYNLERAWIDNIMPKQMWNKTFVGRKKQFDNEVWTEEDYNRSMILCDKNKVEKLVDDYRNKQDPIYDDEKDFYILPEDIYNSINEIDKLEKKNMLNIHIGIEKEDFYDVTYSKSGEAKVKSSEFNRITDKYEYDDNNIIRIENKKQFSSLNSFTKIPINSYFKNNTDRIIGNLQTDTGQYGRPMINNVSKDTMFIKDELHNKLQDIKCKYIEKVIEDIDEEVKEHAIDYISETQVADNGKPIYELKKFSHFIFNNKIYFKENSGGYSVEGLKKEQIEQLKYLIKLKETTHEILQEEEKGNLEVANEKRKELLDTYNEFYSKYNKRINDKEIKKLIAEDDDKGLLLSLEVGTDEIVEVIKTKKKTLKGNIEDYDIVGTEIINNVEVNIIEDEDGEKHYYDKNGTEYIKEQKTEFVIKEGKEGLAQIFFEPLIKVKREIESVNNAYEGMILSLQTEGNINLDYIKNKTNLSEKQIINDLKGYIYFDFTENNNKWVTSDEFLSGNIIKKIENNEMLIKNLQDENIELNELLKQYEKENNEEAIKDTSKIIEENDNKMSQIDENLNELKKVVPKTIPFELIDISLGATWFPSKYYKKFIFDVLKSNKEVVYSDKTVPARYIIKNKNWGTINSIEILYGTSSRNALEILESALNLTPIKVYDTIIEDGVKKQVLNSEQTAIANKRADDLKQAFVSWKENSFTDDEKKEIEEIYNKQFNCIVPRKFNGDILDFPAMNQNIVLKKHQKNGIARMVFGGNTGLAHCVGSGKTFEICAGVMKFKQLGLANKSMIVVPKPLIEQWQREFLNLYPTANIIAPTEKDFSKENRSRFLSRLAMGNYDAIILSQEQFQKIPLSKERQIKYINEQIDEFEQYITSIRDDDDFDIKLQHSTIKDIQKEIDNLQTQLLKLNNEENKDNIINFEELHIDKLFVDEAHYYKNSYFATKLKRVAGIQSKMTKRTFDLQQKCKYLNEKTDNKGVYFATGTPITNSVVEIYTMMKYLQEDKLKDMGINTLDDFVSNFCEIKTSFELDNTGTKYREKTRVNTFKNVPEIIKLFKDNWDIVNVEDLTSKEIPEDERIKLPTIKRETVVLPPTEMQKVLTEDLVRRSELMQPGMSYNPKIDNHLKLTNDGKTIALDPRLFDNKLPDEPNTKTNALIENVSNIYFNTLDEKGTQMIFSDIGVPKTGKEFDIYNDIKNKLISKGIPANEIAFIGDFDTPEKKQQMQQNMREGKIRILLASTDKGGTGLNVQIKMKAMHHLSLPWRPSDVDQREGRIYRQGNKWNEIEIYTYIQKGTFDARTFEILEQKSKCIKQIMQGNEEIRRYDNIGEEESNISYEEWVQLALPDSNIKKIKELERDISLLEAEKKQFDYKKRENYARLKELPKDIEYEKNAITLQGKDVERLKKEKNNSFYMKVLGLKIGDAKEYTEKTNASKRLHERIFNEDINIYYKSELQKVAEYKGFEINVSYQPSSKNFIMRAKSKETGYLYEAIELGNSDIGNMTRIDNFIEKLDDNRIQNHINKLKHLEDEQKDIEKNQNIKFDKEEILKVKKQELQNLRNEEEIKKNQKMEDIQEEKQAKTQHL